MLVACEAMRGHLVGPERTGDMELVELEDRFVLRFDPCGSGGRTLRGDSIEGTPPRMQPPYDWTVTEEPHTWNHNTPGVCLYCTHCIILMEEMPIDRFGYPVRVVDPPRLRRTRTSVGEVAEVPVADVQGPDPGPRGVLHASRANEADDLRVQGAWRPSAAGHERRTSWRRLITTSDPTLPRGAAEASSSAAPHFFVTRLLPSEMAGHSNW